MADVDLFENQDSFGAGPSSPSSSALKTPSKTTKIKTPVSSPGPNGLNTPKKVNMMSGSPSKRAGTPQKSAAFHVPSPDDVMQALGGPFDRELYLKSLPQTPQEPMILPDQRVPRENDMWADYRYYDPIPDFTFGDVKEDKKDMSDVSIRVINPETGAPYEKNGKFATGIKVKMPPMILDGLAKNKKAEKYDKWHLVFKADPGNQDHVDAIAFWDKFYELAKNKFFPYGNAWKNKFQIKKRTGEGFNRFVYREQKRDGDGELIIDLTLPGSIWPTIANFEQNPGDPPRTFDGTTKVYDMTLPMVNRGGVMVYQEVPWTVLHDIRVVAVPTYKIYRFRCSNSKLSCPLMVDNVFIVQHLGLRSNSGNKADLHRMTEMGQQYAHYISKPHLRQPKYDTKSNGDMSGAAVDEFMKNFNG